MYGIHISQMIRYPGDCFLPGLLIITTKEEATGPTAACDHFEICTIAIMTVLNRHGIFVS